MLQAGQHSLEDPIVENARFEPELSADPAQSAPPVLPTDAIDRFLDPVTSRIAWTLASVSYTHLTLPTSSE
ncbi:MAG: hypothetical protein QUU85_12515, partial [Candidatus Eisenbacteria bacterium]|nr:hypothetical protein [Candidatus Eisenbacteria bacterium]